MLLYPERGSQTRLSSDASLLGDLETWLLERCPLLLATQQRFCLMRGLTQPLVRSGMQLASLPSGLMDDLLCTAFFRQVAEVLRPEGVFIVSFITPPDHWKPYSRADLEQQRLLFQDVVPVRWMCHRDEATTRAQLAEAGLEVISVHYDEHRMFPAVLARKHGSALL